MVCKHKRKKLGNASYNWKEGVATIPQSCSICGKKLPDLTVPVFDEPARTLTYRDIPKGFGFVDIRRKEDDEWF